MPAPTVERAVDDHTVPISSPDKVYFEQPQLTKIDVVDYFIAVGAGIWNAIGNRPVTMERWPNGYRADAQLATRANPAGDAFYQKRAPRNTPDWVHTAPVTFPSGRRAEQICPQDLATIIWMANLGTLRFHPWPVSAPETERVDQLRIDLDPQPGTDFADAARAAIQLRSVLDDAGLTGFCKTSGGRGLHVFVPVLPDWGFIEARHAVIALGRELARRMPSQVTTNWWKEERGQRVFTDFNQMARDRTISSAYSIRPTPQARVSAPLDWNELTDCRPDDFTVSTMITRFADRGDVWQGLYRNVAGDLGPALEMYARDERDHGLGEMPYPPEYPKMAGEPARVQPSRRARP
jgi:DNA ligase D-like protein (predicted polymerase)